MPEQESKGQEILSYIINRASFDAGFREALMTDPQQTLLPLGVEITPAQADAIMSMDNAEFKARLQALGSAFGVQPAFN
jgi:hypothetical protein